MGAISPSQGEPCPGGVWESLNPKGLPGPHQGDSPHHPSFWVPTFGNRRSLLRRTHIELAGHHHRYTMGMEANPKWNWVNLPGGCGGYCKWRAVRGLLEPWNCKIPLH